MTQREELTEALMVRYNDPEMTLRHVATLEKSTLYEAICHGVEYNIEMFAEGEYNIDDTNDLTCNECASDVDLCECKVL